MNKGDVEATVRVKTDLSQFKAGMREIESDLKKSGRTIRRQGGYGPVRPGKDIQHLQFTNENKPFNPGSSSIAAAQSAAILTRGMTQHGPGVTKPNHSIDKSLVEAYFRRTLEHYDGMIHSAFVRSMAGNKSVFGAAAMTRAEVIPGGFYNTRAPNQQVLAEARRRSAAIEAYVDRKNRQQVYYSRTLTPNDIPIDPLNLRGYQAMQTSRPLAILKGKEYGVAEQIANRGKELAHKNSVETKAWKENYQRDLDEALRMDKEFNKRRNFFRAQNEANVKYYQDRDIKFRKNYQKLLDREHTKALNFERLGNRIFGGGGGGRGGRGDGGSGRRSEGNKKEESTVRSLSRAYRVLRNILTSLTTLFVANEAVRMYLRWNKALIETNARLERVQLGVAQVTLSAGRFVDEQGKALDMSNQLLISFQNARYVHSKLLEDAIQYGLNFAETVEIFPAILGPALRLNESLEDTVNLTRNIVIFGQKLGITQTQLVRTIDNLVKGVRVQNTELGSALGITTKEVQEWRKKGTLMEEFAKRLEGVTNTLDKQAKTYDGIKNSINSLLTAIAQEASFLFFESAKNTLTKLRDTLQDLRDDPNKMRELSEAIDKGFGAMYRALEYLINNSSKIIWTFDKIATALSYAFPFGSFIMDARDAAYDSFGPGSNNSRPVDTRNDAVSGVFAALIRSSFRKELTDKTSLDMTAKIADRYIDRVTKSDLPASQKSSLIEEIVLARTVKFDALSKEEEEEDKNAKRIGSARERLHDATMDLLEAEDKLYRLRRFGRLSAEYAAKGALIGAAGRYTDQAMQRAEFYGDYRSYDDLQMLRNRLEQAGHRNEGKEIDNQLDEMYYDQNRLAGMVIEQQKEVARLQSALGGATTEASSLKAAENLKEAKAKELEYLSDQQEVMNKITETEGERRAHALDYLTLLERQRLEWEQQKKIIFDAGQEFSDLFTNSLFGQGSFEDNLKQFGQSAGRQYISGFIEETFKQKIGKFDLGMKKNLLEFIPGLGKASGEATGENFSNEFLDILKMVGVGGGGSTTSSSGTSSGGGNTAIDAVNQVKNLYDTYQNIQGLAGMFSTSGGVSGATVGANASNIGGFSNIFSTGGGISQGSMTGVFSASGGSTIGAGTGAGGAAGGAGAAGAAGGAATGGALLAALAIIMGSVGGADAARKAAKGPMSTPGKVSGAGARGAVEGAASVIPVVGPIAGKVLGKAVGEDGLIKGNSRAASTGRGAAAGAAIGAIMGPMGVAIGAILGAILGAALYGQPTGGTLKSRLLAPYLRDIGLDKSVRFGPGSSDLKVYTNLRGANAPRNLPASYRAVMPQFRTIGEANAPTLYGQVASAGRKELPNAVIASILGASADLGLAAEDALGLGREFTQNVTESYNKGGLKLLAFRRRGRINQGQLQDALGGLIVSYKELEQNINGAALAQAAFTEDGLVSLKSLERAAEDAQSVITGGVVNALKKSVESGNAYDAATAMAESFSETFINRVAERLAATGSFGEILSTAVALATKAAEALAAGDIATYQKYIVQARESFQTGQKQVSNTVGAILPYILGNNTALGVFPGGAIVNQTGAGIPSFATDTRKVVPGAMGQPSLAIVHGGETVYNPKYHGDIVTELRRSRMTPPQVVVNVTLDGKKIAKEISITMKNEPGGIKLPNAQLGVA